MTSEISTRSRTILPTPSVMAPSAPSRWKSFRHGAAAGCRRVLATATPRPAGLTQAAPATEPGPAASTRGSGGGDGRRCQILAGMNSVLNHFQQSAGLGEIWIAKERLLQTSLCFDEPVECELRPSEIVFSNWRAGIQIKAPLQNFFRL